MTEQIIAIVGQSLAESTETMAFVSLMPAEQPCPMPEDLLRVSIAFSGPFSGSLELAAPLSFGATLAANMLGCEATDPNACSRAADAMKELMNVTCGDLLARLADGKLKGFELGLPTVEPLSDRADWESYVTTTPENVFDAEGHFLAIRLKGGPR
jgi:chemotaxis protein CheY-P-specific phosphatase CheC